LRFSFKIVRLFGIDIRLHILFVALVVGLFWKGAGGDLRDFWMTAGMIVALFSSVLLHEFGHAIAARHKGIRVLDVTLWPLGGMARLAETPRAPMDELAIAAAGPLVNLGIAAILLVVVLALSGPINLDLFALRAEPSEILHNLFAGNAALALLNLIPAFPLDGGRMFRALLARRRGAYEATRIAVRAGGFIAFLGFVYGIWLGESGWVYVALALFVWFSGLQELRGARLREARLRGWFGEPFGASAPGAPAQSAPANESDGFGGAPAIPPERRAALDAALERLRRQRES
jgi:Zn-dependent protease